MDVLRPGRRSPFGGAFDEWGPVIPVHNLSDDRLIELGIDASDVAFYRMFNLPCVRANDTLGLTFKQIAALIRECGVR